MDFPKPRIFSSRCLGFDACRWNGVTIPDSFIEQLKDHVTFVTTCPEVEIGLGVPRDPIRIVFRNKKYSLMQLNTEKDVTDLMNGFTGRFLDSVDEIDGFILKDRSPSCGIKDVKVYPDLKPSGVIQKASGFFAKEVLERFPHVPVETEARLTNFSIREHFLTRIFTVRRFREIKSEPSIGNLVRFHSENKFLLMAYSQKQLSVMGRVVANHGKKDPKLVFEEYETHLSSALSKSPRPASNLNVVMHALGYFSKKITPEERKFILNSLEEYRREQVPLSVPLNIMRSYIVRFREEYLMQQSFFDPFPVALVKVTDSGKGRTTS